MATATRMARSGTRLSSAARHKPGAAGLARRQFSAHRQACQVPGSGPRPGEQTTRPRRTGGGVPPCRAARPARWVPSQTRQACVNADRANASAGSVRIRAGPDVVPVEYVLAEPGVPVSGGGRQRRVGVIRRARDGRRRRTPQPDGADPRATSRSPPPARPSALRMMKSPRADRHGCAGEQADRQVEGPPPGVDRRGPAAVRRAELGQHHGGPASGVEVGPDLLAVVGCVLVIGVKRNGPRHFLRLRIDLHVAGHPADGSRAARASPAPTGRSGASGTRSTVPLLCSATASCERRSSSATMRPEPSGLAAAPSPSRARSAAALRAAAAALAAPARPPACRAPGCARAGCRRSRSTARRRRPARQQT